MRVETENLGLGRAVVIPSALYSRVSNTYETSSSVSMSSTSSQRSFSNHSTQSSTLHLIVLTRSQRTLPTPSSSPPPSVSFFLPLPMPAIAAETTSGSGIWRPSSDETFFFFFSFSFSASSLRSDQRRAREGEHVLGKVLLKLFADLVLLGKGQSSFRKEQIVDHDGCEGGGGRDLTLGTSLLGVERLGRRCCRASLGRGRLSPDGGDKELGLERQELGRGEEVREMGTVCR